MRDRDRDRDRDEAPRKRISPLADPSVVIDYKNPQLLRYFLTERGKMVPSRLRGATARQQRQLSKAIKRARILALIPYTVA